MRIHQGDSGSLYDSNFLSPLEFIPIGNNSSADMGVDRCLVSGGEHIYCVKT